ncbi:tyrosine-type recombinase/integrase [Sphaerisporangium aureirubrum]|uniref:Tyrosine-type recombinase/integrase n=1 Tax=Sphaerisporangium aureirubrum TaxID=1544736 RepID=A0ABW1NSX8_9ACTN
MVSDALPSAGSRPGETVSGATRSAPGVASPVRRRPGAQPTALDGAVAEVFADYEEKITRPGVPLDAGSVRVYRSRVRQYLAWLAGCAAEGDPLTDSGARDRAVRDYRAHLQTVAKRRPSTVNAHLAAVDDFYRRRGLGPTAVERAGVPPATSRALDKGDQLRLLREAGRAPLRDKAIAFTAFYAGTRLAETVDLDVGDVRLSAVEGHLIIRRGRGGRLREVPLHPKLRAVLTEWLAERAGWKGAGTGPALFLNHRGGRLSARSAYTVLRAIADAADLPIGRDGVFTPHVLRRTVGTTMTRSGTDIVVVAELLGHSLETARRYGLPAHQDPRKALEGLTVDE